MKVNAQHIIQRSKRTTQANSRMAFCHIAQQIGFLKCVEGAMLGIQQAAVCSASRKGALISKQINNFELIRNSELLYVRLDSSIGNFNGAFEHHKNYIFYRDNILNNEIKNSNLQQQLNYEFDKKEAVLKEQQERERVVSQEKNRKQKIIIWSIISVLALVFGFAIFIWRTLRLTQKQKQIIEKQKEMVEEKQKEILDSIRYAKRIQDALMTSQKYIERNLKRLKNNK